MYKNLIFFTVLLIINTHLLLCLKIEQQDIDFNQLYIIKLINGDIISGKIIEISLDENGKQYLKINTLIGTTKVYENEIQDIFKETDKNRNRHKHFILPSSFPIHNNHFISNYALAAFYFGFGITEYFSLTAGRTFVPTVRSEHQLSVLNLKLTPYSVNWDEMPGGMKIGLGANIGFANHDNQISHIYGNFTFYGDKTDITGLVYSKIGTVDYYEFRINENKYDFIFENGSFGIGVGITTELSKNHDLYLIGELWNTNITKKNNTALLGAIRISNQNISADFGFVFMTVPYFFPVMSFTWTPF